jgi:hypothetical protein
MTDGYSVDYLTIVHHCSVYKTLWKFKLIYIMHKDMESLLAYRKYNVIPLKDQSVNAVKTNTHYSVQKSNGRNDLVRGDVEKKLSGEFN